MDRTAAYEAADGSSSLPEGTMEPWQRWSMRGTENPENEVRVLGVPQEYMVSVAQMEERRVVAPVARGSIPFRHTTEWGYSSAVEQWTVNPWGAVQILLSPQKAQMAKRSTRRSAKPVSAGPNPALSSERCLGSIGRAAHL